MRSAGPPSAQAQPSPVPTRRSRGAALTPVIEDILGEILNGLGSRRAERVTETLIDAAAELGGDAAGQHRRFVEAAASDETYQELLALDDSGTVVDDEIAFVRDLADLDPVHVLKAQIAVSAGVGRPDWMDWRLGPVVGWCWARRVIWAG
jgi:hypothetical protein